MKINIMTSCPFCKFYNPVTIDLAKDQRKGLKMVTCNNVKEKYPDIEPEEQQKIMDKEGPEGLYEKICEKPYVVEYVIEITGKAHKIEGL